MTDLHPTPTRLALLQDIAEGQLYFEAENWWDAHGYKRTAAVGQLTREGWTTWEKATAESKRPGELTGRIYARLTEVGERVLKEGDQR